MSFSSIDKVGQILAHDLQLVHLSLSIPNPKMLILFVNDNRAPMGQKVEHCIRFFVMNGRITTNPAKSETNTTVLKNISTEVTFSYSVTVLNGQSQSQYAGDKVAAEASATISRTANDIHLKDGFTFFIIGFFPMFEKPSSQPP